MTSVVDSPAPASILEFGRDARGLNQSEPSSVPEKMDISPSQDPARQARFEHYASQIVHFDKGENLKDVPSKELTERHRKFCAEIKKVQTADEFEKMQGELKEFLKELRDLRTDLNKEARKAKLTEKEGGKKKPKEKVKEGVSKKVGIKKNKSKVQKRKVSTDIEEEHPDEEEIQFSTGKYKVSIRRK